uniref:Uncharacterized protein n=1 Tax=Anopheles stephensi TaxID=30069 RepID=A0A182Y1H1_ANOST
MLNDECKDLEQYNGIVCVAFLGSHNAGQLGNNLNVTSNTTTNQLIMSTKQLQLKLQQQQVQQQQQQQQTQQIIAATSSQPQPDP